MLAEGLHTYLAADNGVAGLLGGKTLRADKRDGVFPMVAPEAPTMPYIIYQQVGGEPLQTSMEGVGRLQASRWRFSAYGTTYKNAKQLAKKLKDALNSLNGNLAASNVFIEGCWPSIEADDSEPIPHGTIYASHVDYDINFLDTE